MSEINDLIASSNRNFEKNLKKEVGHMFMLAEAICTRIAYTFAPEQDRNENTIVQPWLYYPKLFEEDKDNLDRLNEGKELEDYKAMRMKYATEHNKRRREAEINECES